ncbi:DUF3247 family protein [Pseudoxanthomonas dokdonensis]|uniref:DUF3247 domain-containing protein n=1 Tax=Pseudoxanthomonas dokdonensis TaxID=344882 RepID=A0A0R0CVF4_9GAMM|nr:DUF3247 family protein [Pseudoxanthomonas dokdonensis]KRG69982.1 hypothetical protein ABB29_06990 [Pseudoxanthomonas dokdonensis]
MHERPQQIYADQADIDRLEALISSLDDEAIVALTLHDGRRIKGVVSVRPTLQLFRDDAGQQGFNSVLRLDDAEQPQQTHYLWLDQIAQVDHLGTD